MGRVDGHLQQVGFPQGSPCANEQIRRNAALVFSATVQACARDEGVRGLHQPFRCV
jgi:hypothetical protein